jgi:flagellin
MKRTFRRKKTMIINHNITALNTHRQLSTNTAATSKNIEKLSSGLRINRAGDDAAGLAISEKMRGQIRGLDMASKNAQDGISLIQTAEGALNETHSILQRMRELAVQSSNDTNNDNDRGEIQKEADQLAQEITRIANSTEFNTKSLLNGAVSSAGEKAATFHIGANAGQSLDLSIGAMDAKSLGISGDTKAATSTSVGGKVASVTYDNSNLGAKVVDAATVSLTYTAAGTTPVSTAKITGAATDVTGTDLTAKTASMTVNVGGTDYKINDMSSWDGTGTEAALLTLIGNADTIGDGTGTKLSTVASVTAAGGKISIETTATGASTSATVTFGGADAADVATLTGITSGATASGADAGATAAKVTITDGTTTQDITVADTTATSLTVATGNYSGLTFKFTGTDTIANIGTTGTTDQVKVKVATENASAATFDSTTHKKTADAVTKAGIDMSTQTAANSAITSIQTAIEKVSSERSKLGAVQNRFEHTINNLNTSSENLTAAESRVRDVDMAKEMMEQTKNNILAQAAQAMLAQANQQPQGVLQLLR